MHNRFFNYFLICICTTIADLAGAQTNLVSNPGFEVMDSCYGDISPSGFDVFQWSGCSGWNTPTYGSTDLWCHNPVVGIYSVPATTFGFQYPRTGNNMAGLYIYASIQSNYREYFQNKLIAPLEANKYYEISFYANSSDTLNYSSDIGIYFSNNPVSDPASTNKLPYVPQVQNQSNNFITDTLGWQKVSGIYKANGGEEYIAIGCFNDSSSIILSNYNASTPNAVYLFVDDVSLTSTEMEIPNIFSPNGDGINDEIDLSYFNLTELIVSVYNRWGQKVFESSRTNTFWNGKNMNNVDCPAGVYYYVFEYVEFINKTIDKNGFIQLVR